MLPELLSLAVWVPPLLFATLCAWAFAGLARSVFKFYAHRRRVRNHYRMQRNESAGLKDWRPR